MRDKHPTQKLITSITLALVLLLGSATTVIAWRMHSQEKAPAPATHQQTTKPVPITHLSYHGQEGKTALELLKQQKHVTVVTKDSSYGPYVDSINGVAGGTGGKYWAFYVNGTLASVGAGAYTTHSTDTVEWKFE